MAWLRLAAGTIPEMFITVNLLFINDDFLAEWEGSL
jgi:hypothetical protein